MDRFLCFSGPIHYPRGGMSDLVGEYEDAGKAINAAHAAAITSNRHEEDGDVWRHSWAHVYDTLERRIIWDSADH